MGNTQELEAFKKLIRDFTENEVKPLAKQVDEEEMFPMETFKKMGKLGMLGIPFPRELGGAGGTQVMYSLLVTELAKACASTSVVLSAHTSLCCQPIFDFGTEDQKKKYLPRLCSGELIGAFGLTEPNAGTDAAGQQTIAEKDKNGNYIINGSKIFITNAGFADLFIIFAMTDKSQGVKGISAFIMERKMKGFSVGKPELKMGIRGSSTCELIFDNVKVPKENLLGKEGQGFSIAMKTLDGGRVGIASQALGIAMGALDETIKYVKERRQFNKPISAFQNTQFKIADMAAQTEAARLLVLQAAEAKENHAKDLSVKASMAKLVAAENAMNVTTKCVQLFGGYGYTREYPVERMMRDAKITEIYEGTSEVQRMVISGAVMK